MDPTNPQILLMGLRRSGKSSIRHVVFHNMQPLETLYLESTMKPTIERLDSLISVSLREIPGQIETFEQQSEDSSLYKNISSIVYVIDSQDDYLLALQNIVEVIEQAYKVNPAINFEALIHKVDGLNDDFRQDTQRDIVQRVNDDLADVGVTDANITFHMTSIFDNSIIESFSRILQKLVPEFPALTQMLDLFCQRSGSEKAFLFDAGSKIYFATDSNPVDVETYQVCSDFIDVSLDLSQLYKQTESAAPISATSKLQNEVVIHLEEMVKGLLLVCMSRNDDSVKSLLLAHNVGVFKKGLQELYVS